MKDFLNYRLKIEINLNVYSIIFILFTFITILFVFLYFIYYIYFFNLYELEYLKCVNNILEYENNALILKKDYTLLDFFSKNPNNYYPSFFVKSQSLNTSFAYCNYYSDIHQNIRSEQ
jgi:hypothetical protein